MRQVAKLSDDLFGASLYGGRTCGALGSQVAKRGEVLLVRLGREPHAHGLVSFQQRAGLSHHVLCVAPNAVGNLRVATRQEP